MFLYPFQKEKIVKFEDTVSFLSKHWINKPSWSPGSGGTHHGQRQSDLNLRPAWSTQSSKTASKTQSLNICPQTFHQRYSYQKKVKYILFLAQFKIQEKKHEVGLGINLERAGEEKGCNKSIWYANLKNNEQGENLSQAVAKTIRVDKKTIKSGNTTRH